MIRVGVDTGGTFTDLVLLEGARVVSHKVRSTPDDPSRAILTGLAELTALAGAETPPTERGGPPDARASSDMDRRAVAISDVVHGSTVATNAVLERKGARVALVTTAGFEDVLRIGRQTRRELYNFLVEDRRPLVEPELTFGIRERLAADGAVLDPLDEAAIDPLIDTFRARGVQAVAVCLLHAYVNPAHEQAIAARLERAGFTVSASHRVLPEYREFERWSTTVVNAYVTPLMATYLSALESRLNPEPPSPTRPGPLALSPGSGEGEGEGEGERATSDGRAHASGATSDRGDPLTARADTQAASDAYAARHEGAGTEHSVSLDAASAPSPSPSGHAGERARGLGGVGEGSPIRLSIMQSNGGSISAARAKMAAVQTILSGPAAGAVGAQAVAVAAGYPQIIGFDMGGTSTDVTLIDGTIGVTTESTVGDFPVRLPIIDIHTVGAGGGSIAYVDAGGALRVGPRSAGADPGPACYGKGNELTVTDANLLLGRLDPAYFLGGRMTLNEARARRLAQAFASRVGLSDTALAEGIVRVANANMERAIRVVSVQRGFDPRDFALLAFGGAGGMHACEIADTLNIATVIAPRYAGVLSALGMLLADVTKDYSLTVLRADVDVTRDELDARFAPLVARAHADLESEGFTGDRAIVECALDVRYVGQAYEITVPFEADYRAAFDRRHQQLYGYANPRRAAEVVNLRVRAIGVTSKPRLPREPVVETAAAPPFAVRPARFGGRAAQVAVYRRDDLHAGMSADGPALITGAEATTVIPPHFAFRVDQFGNVIATRRPASAPRLRRVAQRALATIV